MSEIGPNDPVPVGEAVRLFYPAGGVKAATLFQAIRDGSLAFERHGRAYMITRANWEAWRETCHKSAKGRGSPSTGEGAGPRSTRSGTGDFSEAQAAALMNAQKLRKRLPITSRPDDRTPAAVIPMRSGLPKC